ncbi:AAA family ATPase [Terribacillus saccharophilus]|uniref:AAA family ATPase n=1 Tax=Terribacillus saccharophilus TaxID=361277 RepID=A0ABX4GYG5_9BACI|nr:AAA family ATPase [Terribacillus saccharophilus]PAD35795.1 AAA family ATPase [Terribacillus saccharophilus]PAD96334.1 AAA family ATPase [Terribacillus saccharophilus]PAD99909.1 AAA family ATPase [Terribacillus saccharophilus]
MFLKRVKLLQENSYNSNAYPFTIPALQQLNELDFKKPVTFFVGENGSGKSTLMEAIADLCGFNTAGGGRNNTYDLEASEAALSDHIRLSWLPKVTKGFFLRAESFYHFASHIDDIGSIQAYGGKSLHHQSHGEAFLSLFQNRFGGKAIYLLDEPEAALSPQRQLTFLRIIHDLEKTGEVQFIIATHSPILLGYPGAEILHFSEDGIRSMVYEETEHYQITRGFLENREGYLKHLFQDG